MAITKVTSGVRDIATGEVVATDLASTLDLSGKTVTLPAASVTAHVTQTDTTGIEDDIALLGFRVASNGSLAKYNLVDQIVDDFQDATGVNASSSTNEARVSGYYRGETTVTPTVTGGTITTDGDYKVHSFTANANYVTDTAQTVDYLIVAGGGGGGGNYGGGGGAGGFRYLTGQSLAAGTFAVVVGAGSTYTGTGQGQDGGDSSINSLSATGGGGGGASGGDARNGGSGGGGSNQPSSATGTGNEGSYTPVEGYDGGDGLYSGNMPGGGGGGSSEVGNDHAGSSTGGAGGDGTANSITGASVTYAGGGGAGANDAGGAVGGAGGAGGGGAGLAMPAPQGTRGGDATGYGSGGGGGGYGLGYSGAGKGSDGIVIVRRPTTSISEGSNLTLVSTTTAAQAAPTKGDIVMTYTNGAGTTSLGGVDLTAEISADGGSTWTAMTLGAEGSTGTHNIVTAHDVTITSTITSPYNMAYRIKTLNQSASKTTRIQAVSLGWS